MVKNIKRDVGTQHFSTNEDITVDDFQKYIDLDIKDPDILEKYYTFLTEAIPKVFESINGLMSQNISKEVIETYKMRLEALNRRYENEAEPEVLSNITREVSEIHSLIQKESDAQRSWLKSIGFGVLGATTIAGATVLGVRNKEVIKSIAKVGVGFIRK